MLRRLPHCRSRHPLRRSTSQRRAGLHLAQGGRPPTQASRPYASDGLSQVASELTGTSVAILALLGQHLIHHRIYRGRHRQATHIAQRGRRGVHLGVENRMGGGAVKGHLATQHLVAHDTQRIEIRAVVQRLILDLLRAHVAGRAKDSTCPGQRRRHTTTTERLDETKVGQNYPTRRIDQNVRRLDVTVDKTALVGVIQRRADLRDDIHHLLRREGRVRANALHQRGALDEFHRDVMIVTLDTHVVNGDDIGLLEVGCRHCLLMEASDELSVARQVGGQHLECHVAPQGGLPGLVDRGHSPFTDQFDDLILAKRTSYQAVPLGHLNASLCLGSQTGTEPCVLPTDTVCCRFSFTPTSWVVHSDNQTDRTRTSSNQMLPSPQFLTTGMTALS